MTSKQTTTAVRGGIGLPSALFLIFLVLKLTGFITWSWWWVTCPLWISFAIGFAAWLLAVLIFGGVFLFFLVAGWVN